MSASWLPAGIVLIQIILRLLLLGFCGLALGQYVQVGVTNYRYTGFLNVWHEGRFHTPVAIPSANTYVGLRNTCANFCSINTPCDAFYLNETISTCYLVDEDLEPNVPRRVGHHWRKPDIYFVKEIIGLGGSSSPEPGSLSGIGEYTGSEPQSDLSSSNVPANTEGITVLQDVVLGSCDGDGDEDNLAYWQCLTLSYDALTYYTCPSGASANYTETLQVVTDRNCPFEDRIAQCELEGGEVSSNIYQNRRELFEPVLSRVEEDIYGGLFYGIAPQFILLNLKETPKVLNRVIIRSSGFGINKLRSGTLLVHSETKNSEFRFGFQDRKQCALMFNFQYISNPIKNSVESIEIRDMNWFEHRDSLPKGLKMDVYVLPVVLSPLPTTTTTTQTTTTSTTTTSTTTTTTSTTTTTTETTTTTTTTTSTTTTTTSTTTTTDSCSCACPQP